MNDLRFAFRQLRNAPAFTATALATVAICLGANLAIFAVIDSILLRPLPFPESDRLVTIFNTYPKAGVERDGSSLTNYYERRGSIPAFASLSIYRETTEVVGEPGSTQQEKVLRIIAGLFHDARRRTGDGPQLQRGGDDHADRAFSGDCGRRVLAALPQCRSARPGTVDPRKWSAQARSSASCLLTSASSPRRHRSSCRSPPGWSNGSGAAPFWRRRHSHDCAIETGRDHRRSTVTDRRSQRRRRDR